MSVSPRIAYHLDELDVARDPTDNDHILPTVLPADRVILDVGCGIGQTLVSLELNNDDLSISADRLLVGIDIEHESLAFGHEQFDSVSFANSAAEMLPFADNSFDLIISRVALPYTDIPQALAEMHRVTKPGGRVWITLHPKRKTLAQFVSAIKAFRLKDIIFRSYILANGLSFHVAGKLFEFPFNKKTESFQTTHSITKALHSSGFTDVVITRDRHFLATGNKALAMDGKPHSVQPRPSPRDQASSRQRLPLN